MSEAIIKFIDVVKSFGPQLVLDGVNLEIETGKTTVVVGGSGQGKSVLLRLILGLLRPDSGKILVAGKDITFMRRKELNEMRSNFGVLFQGAALFDSMSVFDNVALPLRERTRLPETEISARVSRVLSLLGLSGHEEKFPAQLSGGMRKRVGLARALQLEPKIMLFDEPTTGLDPAKSMEIYHLFHETQRQFGYTSVIVSHDIPKIFKLADQIVVLNDGCLSKFDSPEAIVTSEREEIRSFVQNTMGHAYLSQEME